MATGCAGGSRPATRGLSSGVDRWDEPRSLLGNNDCSRARPAWVIQLPTASRVGSVISTCTGRCVFCCSTMAGAATTWPVADSSRTQLHQTARPQPTIDAEIEQRDFPAPMLHAHPDRRDLLQFNGAFWPTSLPLLQGSRRAQAVLRASMAVSNRFKTTTVDPRPSVANLTPSGLSRMSGIGLLIRKPRGNFVCPLG